MDFDGEEGWGSPNKDFFVKIKWGGWCVVISSTTLYTLVIILKDYKGVRTLRGSVGHQRTAKSWTSARTRIVAAMVLIMMNIDDGNNDDKVITLMMIIMKINMEQMHGQ